MIKYYIARLVIWAVNVVQARRNNDTELINGILTNYSNIISDSSRYNTNDDDLEW